MAKKRRSNTVQIALPSHPLFWTSVGGIGALLLNRALTREPRVDRVAAAPPMAQDLGPLVPMRERSVRSESTGICVQDGKLRVHDWSAWMTFAPDKMDLAVHAGARTAGDVLKVVLEAALPHYPWPPPRGSKMREQWEALSGVVAESLDLPNPPPDDRREEATPRLRLVT